jgi:hypothetical protein
MTVQTQTGAEAILTTRSLTSEGGEVARTERVNQNGANGDARSRSLTNGSRRCRPSSSKLPSTSTSRRWSPLQEQADHRSLMIAFGRITGVGVQNIDAKSRQSGRAVVRVPPNLLASRSDSLGSRRCGRLRGRRSARPRLCARRGCARAARTCSAWGCGSSAALGNGSRRLLDMKSKRDEPREGPSGLLSCPRHR